MPLNLGIAQIPTPSDAFGFVESTIGNVVEGVIEGVTGQQVELTPGNGVNNTQATGPSGAKADVKFDKDLVSYEDYDRTRKEVEKELRATSGRINRLEIELKTLKRLQALNQQKPNFHYPTGPAHGWPGQNGQSNQSLNPMLLMMLAGSDGLKSNPFFPLFLMQSMSSLNFGQVGPGGQLQVDMSSVMMVALMMSELTTRSRSAPALTTAAPATGPN